MSIPRFCRPPRVRAGIQFQFAIENGLALGRDNGGFAVKTMLQPTKVATNTSR